MRCLLSSSESLISISNGLLAVFKFECLIIELYSRPWSSESEIDSRRLSSSMFEFVARSNLLTARLPTVLISLGCWARCETSSGMPNLCIISMPVLAQSSNANLFVIGRPPSLCLKWLTSSNSTSFHVNHSTRNPLEKSQRA